jgi:hypothetical protein
MKKLIFISTGRCGTKRIAQILNKYLPEEFTVVHQMPFSRLANLVGNMFFYLGTSEKIKHLLYNFITSKYRRGKHFICSDPLTAMIIPKAYVDLEDVCIVHIVRNAEAFADSFFNLSRQRFNSFIAHNLIPFWQIGIWPLENWLNPEIKKKYRKIAELKNNYFTEAYSSNPNFKKVEMETIFSSNFLNNLIHDFFHYAVDIPAQALKIKAN